MSFIPDYLADVVCLQEVDVPIFHNFFRPQLKQLAYMGLYKQRTGNKTDGVAIFFQKDKYISTFQEWLLFRFFGF
jgi:mRNA deadenylase 3'-5' endonuclease subunit Ccr4